MNRSTLRLSCLVLIAACCVSLSVGAAEKKEDVTKRDEAYELYKVFIDTLDQVERNYVKEVDRRQLIEAAIEGMLDKLDPYSSYIGPDQLKRFETSVESKFGGIGIQINVDRGVLTIISPLVGSPAYKAGLQAGDRVITRLFAFGDLLTHPHQPHNGQHHQWVELTFRVLEPKT